MRSTILYAAILFLFGFLPTISFSQSSYSNLFYNNGDIVVVESGAVLRVQGDINNAAGGSSNFTNNGLINVEGDFTNAGTFKTDGAITGGVGEGTVRFIGNPTVYGTSGTSSGTANLQTIYGTTSFYNLVVDKQAAGQLLALAPHPSTPATAATVTVAGSLVWSGYSTTAATYSPSGFSSTLGSSTIMTVRTYGVPSGNGVIQTYAQGGTVDQELYVSNGAPTAVAGYQGLAWGTAASTEDKSIRTRGARGVGLGGLSREVWQTSQDYIYPLSTATHTYNPIKFNFTAVASSSSNKIRGMFCDAAGSSAVGTIGKSLSSQSDFSSVAPAAVPTVAKLDNNGYNLYRSNPCVPGHKNWMIFDNLPSGGGYWSFDGSVSNTYRVELYPNNMTFTAAGIAKNNIRALKYHNGAPGTSDIAFDPSSVDWGTQVESVVNLPNDLYTYTGFMNVTHTGTGASACSSTNTGVPGGLYAGFSHFQAAGAAATNGNALPVKLIALSADPIRNTYIRVNWSTASETDNKGFEVIRTADGTNFTTLGWVDGSGTTAEQHNYLFNDNTAQPNTVYYYKLNQLDVDGRSNETYVVSAEITGGPSITVSEFMPNPTLGKTRLVISTTETQPVSIKFYDILGKLIISSEDNQVAYGTNTFDFDMNTLADATYTAIIRIGGNVYSKKVVLVK